MIGLPFDENIEIRMLENVFDDMTNSYKIFWFIGIFEEICRKQKTISFKNVVARMIVKAWYPLLNYHLNFGPQDQMSKNINIIFDRFITDKDIPSYRLYNELSETSNKELEGILAIFYRYVPYRLLRGFYKNELKGLKDGVINKEIESLSWNDARPFYRISTENKEVYINENWYKYIYKNQNIIRGWLNYNLIMFLQLKNPSVPAIPLKLEPPIERNLTIAKKYWDIVIRNVNIKDIYSDKKFVEENYLEHGPLSIDHFLPWSFVGHDELWNLVPTFKNINSSKSDSLPSYETYIDSFTEVQFQAINFIRRQKDSKKYLQQYLSIDNSLKIKEIMSVQHELNRNKFTADLTKTINPLYQIAYTQGFHVWTYDIRSKEIIKSDKSDLIVYR